VDNLTVIIPFRDGQATILKLLASLPKLPVIIVDDQSKEPYQSNKHQVIRLDQRGYFSGAVNKGIQSCDTDVLILNQDVWLEDFNWEDLDTQRKTFAMIGDGVFGHPAFPQGYVQGTFMFLRRDAIEKVGLLNEKDYPLWGSTCEYQTRLCRLGFEALPLKIGALHHERKGNYGSSIKQALKDEPNKQSLLVRTPPEISVIITCHNYGRFLNDAVNSLIGGNTILGEMAPQTFQSFEVIIVDDASTDETPEIGKSLANDWKGIHYLRLDKLGGSARAMNAGIKASFGKVIAPLDADDMMESNRLETLYNVLKENPHSCVYDDVMWVERNKRSRVDRLPDYEFEELVQKNGIHKGVMYSRQAWIDTGGYPESMQHGREDWAFNIALGFKGYCGKHIEQPLYLYRRHELNRTNQQEKDMLKGSVNWRRVFYEQIHALYPMLQTGERPMGCCGGGRAANQTIQTGRTQGAFMTQLGQQGMVMLQYLGNKAGTISFYGSVTKTRYLFGGQRTVGYVDSRDVEGFVKLYEGKSPLFQVQQTEEPKVYKAAQSTSPERITRDMATSAPGDSALVAKSRKPRKVKDVA